MKKFFVGMRRMFWNFLVVIWNLNWEAKIGITLIVPSFIYGFMLCDHSFWSTDLSTARLWDFGDHQIIYGDIPNTVTSVPIFLGLLAIAGAYLLKGNLKTK